MSLIRFIRSRFTLGALALVALVIVACASEPTPVPTPTPEPTPIPTPLPTPTPTLEPTATPTPVAAAGPALESLIPEGASLIIEVDPSVVLDSPVLAPLFEVVFEGSEETVFSQFESETGIDLNSIERAEIYMDVEALFAIGRDPGSEVTADSPTLGVALHGNLDEEGFLSKLDSAMKDDPTQEYVMVDYREYSIYVDANRNPENFSFAFVDADTLLFGSTNGLEAMLDVASGVASPESGEGVAALEALGDRDFGMVIVTPPEAIQATMSESPEGMGLMGALGPSAPISVLGVQFGKDSMMVQSRQFFEDEADAAAYKEYNEGLMALMGVMSGSQEIQRLAAGIAITQDGLEVALDMEIEASSLNSILEFLFLMTDAGAPQP